MSDEIGIMSDGRDSMAFCGDRNGIWHSKGQQYQPGWTIDDWAKNAGLNWAAIKVPAIADLKALGFDSKTNTLFGPRRVDGRHFIARSDNGHILSPGTISDVYKIVQPREALDFCQQYVSVDPRFHIDTAMCLRTGEIIAVTATFNGDYRIAGDQHVARLLMSTTFDGSGATHCKALMTRVVCRNTLRAGLSENSPDISIRHNTKFNKESVGKQLAKIAQQFDSYAKMGDAMAAHHMTEIDVSKFFKATLDIDTNAKKEEISAKKFNQFETMVNCYQVGTRQENLEPGTAWSALQAVTRYVDHEKQTRGGDDKTEARFVSAQFGAGALMKAKAVALLDDMADGDLLKAVAATTPTKQARSDADDFSSFLSQSFKPTIDA